MARKPHPSRKFPTAIPPYTLRNWTGIRDAKETTIADPRKLSRAINCYLPAGDPAGGYIGRPGYEPIGDPLPTPVQYLGEITKQDGTTFTVAVAAGQIYTYNWNTGAWAVQVEAADFVTASITFSASTQVFGVVFADRLVLSDGVNPMIDWDGTAGDAGLREITNGPVAYGQPTTYYSKLSVIKANERDTWAWSEEMDAMVGWEAGGYQNAWSMPGRRGESLFAIGPDNDSIAIVREGSITQVRGAISTEFQTTGTRASVGEILGSVSPGGVRMLDEGCFFVDPEGRCWIIPRGGTQAIPLWWDIGELADTFDRQLLGKVQLIEDRATQNLLVGFVVPGSDVPSLWIAFTRNAGQIAPSGVWTGIYAAASGEVRNGLREWTWVHSDPDGQVYAHGRPDGTIWNDDGQPIAHETVTAYVGADLDVEKWFDQVTIESQCPTSMSIAISLETPSGMTAEQTRTMAGGGVPLGQFLLGTDRLASNDKTKRAVFGTDGHGRWVKVRISHAEPDEQFHLTAVRVHALAEHTWTEVP